MTLVALLFVGVYSFFEPPITSWADIPNELQPAMRFTDGCGNSHYVYVDVLVQTGTTAGVLQSYSAPSSTKEYWPACNSQNFDSMYIYICVSSGTLCSSDNIAEALQCCYPYGTLQTSGNPDQGFVWTKSFTGASYTLQPGDKVVIEVVVNYGWLDVQYTLSACYTVSSTSPSPC